MGRRNRQTGSRSSFGSIMINHKGKDILTSVGSKQYEGLFCGLRATSPRTGIIPAGYAHRPDLISDLFLDNPDLWWMVCERNVIFDVFEQLKSGDPIILAS